MANSEDPGQMAFSSPKNQVTVFVGNHESDAWYFTDAHAVLRFDQNMRIRP